MMAGLLVLSVTTDLRSIVIAAGPGRWQGVKMIAG
jgi:hypothetical protein